MPEGPNRSGFTCLILKRGEFMGTVGAERQGIDGAYCGEIEIAIEMRKQRAAARDLPFQFAAEPARIDAHQHEVALAGEMFGRGLDRLRRGRKMDEAVAHINLGAAKYAGALGVAPERGRADFEDSRHAGVTTLN